MRSSIRILVPIFFAAILIHFASSNAFSVGEATKETYVDGREYVLQGFRFYSDRQFRRVNSQDTDLLVRTDKHIWRTVSLVDIKSVEMMRKLEDSAFQTRVVLVGGGEVIGETPHSSAETWLPGELGVNGKVTIFGSQEQYLWVPFFEILKVKSVGGPEFRVEIEKIDVQKAILESVVFVSGSSSGYWARKWWVDWIPVTAEGIDIPRFELRAVEMLVFGDGGKIEVTMIDGNKGVMSFQSEGSEKVVRIYEKVTHVYGELDTGEILFDEIYSHGKPKVRSILFVTDSSDE